MKLWRILGVIVALGLVAAAGVWWYTVAPSAPTEEVINTITETNDSRLSLGKIDAPVQMIEYIDMFCTSCARAHEEVLPKITSEYIDTGKLHYEARVVAKTPHDDAEIAANGAYCAAEQGRFWAFVDHVYAKTAVQYKAGKGPEDIMLFSGTNARTLARDVDVNVPQWENCVKQQSYQDVIEAHEQAMSDVNAYGTPHSIINGKNYNGAPPYRTFKSVIEAALKEVEKQKKKE